MEARDDYPQTLARHLRLERLESWQHVTFMACLCERMYPNYAMFCKQTEFGDGQIY
ncbi:DUF416 family protein, partial [Salmonella enterica subsp. enterica serovar Kentucky]|nr:DUF416 family protein [Salmonella enterica subsp. enterica serovar Kentucky]